MKILLVNPPIFKSEIYANYSAGAPCLPPLGLCYLAAVLEAKGSETNILDCAAENISISQLRAKLESAKPDLVGVTSTTISYSAAQNVLKTVKEVDSTIMTVLGGAHISALSEESMSDCEAINIGVFGEGELTLVEIVDRFDNGQPLTDVAGTLIRSNGRIIKNKPRNSIQNLDILPFPARHLLKNLKRYSHTPFRGARFTTTMVTSRGCPFHCAYCDQSVFGRTWRYHSPDYVLAEMIHLKEKYNIDFISFEDDNFLLSTKRTVNICEGILASSLDISWSCLGRANEVDEKILPLMKKAGCKAIYIGIESGSPRILELINKKMSIETIRKSVGLIKKHHIQVIGSFIVGIPTETKTDIEKTIGFALSLPLDGISFFTFAPFPNTPLRKLAFQHGKVRKEWKNYSGHPNSLPFVPRGMDEKYLLNIQAKAYRRFLLRPGYLITHLGSFGTLRTFKNGLKFVKSLLAGTHE